MTAKELLKSIQARSTWPFCAPESSFVDENFTQAPHYGVHQYVVKRQTSTNIICFWRV